MWLTVLLDHGDILFPDQVIPETGSLSFSERGTYYSRSPLNQFMSFWSLAIKSRKEGGGRGRREVGEGMGGEKGGEAVVVCKIN